MLDTETKRRIDTARDILVGKVPDPKSQVEQITIALIYKFMDDLDALSEELGGQRKFFAHDFAHYGWTKLMRAGLGGHAMLNLYAEAIERMPQNPGIPPLFRSIFNNAYLPYRDPQTLRAFLKIINEFTYDHSERLGDAFEYLLSVFGSQGDAGQFRTPRHIIDFMVALLNPQKEERVLDPACGTAGFLISAYKHILAANTDDQGHSTLTPAERGQLAANICGYDISPDMVRLSLVNLYLHRFVDPHIYEYDTLTSEERWHEYADVILANPPFMTPKGGIRPHSRFVVRSRRSEVLFVSYIAEHLTSVGRAGIIVPEGIIFQSQQAYKQLRKLLVEEMLVAVVSLPSGVFQPYSGVKTSILILDRALARRVEHIAFFKIEHDGYDLGAQRRPIERDDLPLVRGELSAYLHRVRSGEVVDVLQSDVGLVVEKGKIAGNGEYNLSGERYREKGTRSTHWPLLSLGTVVEIESGSRQKGGAIDAGIPSIGGEQIDEKGSIRFDKMKYISEAYFSKMRKGILKRGDVLMVKDGAPGKAGFFAYDMEASVNEHVFIIRAQERIHPYYLYAVVRSQEFQENLQPMIKGSIIGGLSLEVRDLEIPLPPLEVQREIVAEIEGYQKVLDGARLVVDNYRPHLHIDPECPLVELGEVCEINPETINSPLAYPNQTVFYVDISSVENETGRLLGYREISSSEAPSRARRGIRNGDVLLSTVRPNLKAFALLKEVRDRAVASTGFAVLRARCGIADPAFILASVRSDHAVSQMVGMMGKGAYPSINQSDVAAIKIALPSFAMQQAIVAEIEAEQALVAANRELVQRFERKIQAAIRRVWGG